MNRRAVRTSLLVPALLTASLLNACSSNDDKPTKTSSSQAGAGGVSGTIIVFAAASLQESFTTLGKQFESAHPGSRIKFNFAASSALATQIKEGAPADVFASASAKNMDDLVSAGAAANATTFAKNVMEIAVPPSNPAKIDDITDLDDPGVKVALCQAEVPCGVVAAKVFENAHLTVKPVTLEQDVKATLAKVQLGEVDAGVVYVTDVRAAGDRVKGIEIPADVNASTAYPIASLTKSGNASLAQVFVAYVLSAEGQAVLTAAGFAKP